MKEMKLAIVGCVVIIGFAGCDLALVIQGSGVSTTEDREIDDFSKIYFAGSGKATVKCGQDSSLAVTTDDNLLELIETTVSGDTLSITSKGSFSTKSDLQFDIGTGQVNSLTIDGSGKFDIVDCDSESFKLNINGSGNVTITGNADNVDISIAGSGFADLSQLTAKSAKVAVYGSGNVTVNASDKVDVSITGSGRIQYTGNPKVKKLIVGSGKIRQVKSEANATNESDDESDAESTEEDEEED